MSNLRRLVIILFISTLGVSAQELRRQPAQNWDPTRTWVVAIGVLEWKDGETWTSFPKAGRKDAELVEFFKQAGVPRDQILFLKDQEATKERIEQATARHLSRAGEGDMLIFYYTGHGAQDDSGKTFFASYDAGEDLEQSAVSVQSIFRIIERNFKGDKVLLTADCCYSGALADEAANRRTLISYAALTSSRSDALSTADWTFTEALLRGFRGNAKVDRNLDGQIALSEMARYAKSRMWSVEGQLTTFATTRDFSPDMRLVSVVRRSIPAVTERVEVEWQSTWYPATILQVQGNRYKIRYIGYGAEWDEWIDATRLRRRPSTTSVEKLGANNSVLRVALPGTYGGNLGTQASLPA